jgi:hypothetical protein
MESLEKLQNEDTDISMIKMWLEKGNRPKASVSKSQSAVVQSLASQWENLVFEKGVLFRKWTDDKSSGFQAVIPLSQRRTVLAFGHDVRSSGHLGLHKTLAKVRSKYYWPGLQRDVRQYVKGCKFCSCRKRPRMKKRAPMQLEPVGLPMARIATDILGPLPEFDN